MYSSLEYQSITHIKTAYSPRLVYMTQQENSTVIEKKANSAQIFSTIKENCMKQKNLYSGHKYFFEKKVRKLENGFFFPMSEIFCTHIFRFIQHTSCQEEKDLN